MEEELQINKKKHSFVKNDHLLHSYWKVMNWIILWSIKTSPSYMIILFLIGGLSLILQGLILSVVFILIDSMKTKQFTVLNYTFNINDDIIFIYIIFGIVILLLLSGAGQRFFNIKVNNLSVLFEKYLKEQFVNSLSLNKSNIYFNNQLKQAEFMRFFNPNTRLSGRTLRILFETSFELIKIIIFLVICLYLNMILTVILLLLLMPIGYISYKINYNLHDNEIKYEDYQKIASKESIDIFKKYQNNYYKDNKYKIETDTKNYLESYRKRLNFTETSEMIGHIALTLGIGFSLGWILYEYSYGHNKIASVVVYLVALRFFLSSIKSLVVQLSVYTKHFRQVREIYEILQK